MPIATEAAPSPAITLSKPPSGPSPNKVSSSRSSATTPPTSLRSRVASANAPPGHSSHSNINPPFGSAILGPLRSPSDHSEPGDPSTMARGRSNSLLSVRKVQDNYDDQLDQGVGPNLNVDWVDYKGAWLIHLVLLCFGKLLLDIIPGIAQDVSWTAVNIIYDVVTYVMFHYVTGTPFESSGGVYDKLTMWEQIDMGAHYTPTKKWLTILPVALFLLCTHYTRLNVYPFLFTLNFCSTLCLALLPKLPVFHRLRFRFLEGIIGWSNSINDERSGPPTPIEEQMRRTWECDHHHSPSHSPRGSPGNNPSKSASLSG